MIGKTISHYKIVEKLGEGGMGVVYKAEDTKLERTVALKFLPPDAVENEEDKARFTGEARAAAALDHPNICTVYEINEVDGQHYIAMAFVEGKSLKDMIEERPLKIDAAMKIAVQIAKGLSAAHEKGIVHRDIKSANIMVSASGRVKIMDFGLAHRGETSRKHDQGSTLGTIAYSSPEQASGQAMDHRTDIWSFGVTLYEMLTGQLPFRGDYEQAVLYSIINELPEPVTGLRTGIPVELERIIDKAMAKNRDERYQHVDDMLSDLKTLQDEIDPTTSRTGKSTSTRPIYSRDTSLFRKMLERHVFQVLIVYLAAAWGASRLTAWLVDQFVLSPHLTNIVTLTFLSLVPTVILLAFFRVANRGAGWTRPEKIGVPLNICAAVVVLLFVFQGKDLGAATTTVAVENEQGQTVERVIPKSEFRKKLALYVFENESSDSTLNWLQYSIPLLLEYDLLQDRFLRVHSAFDRSSFQRLKNAGFDDWLEAPVALKRKIAKEFHLGYCVFGSYSKQGEEYVITSQLHSTSTDKLVAERRYTGPDLFGLIDEMSVQVKRDMGVPAGHTEQVNDIAVAEMITNSMDAARSIGLGQKENAFEQNWQQSVEHFEAALQVDPIQAYTHFELYSLYMLSNQGDRAEAAIQAAMQHAYKLPERMQFIIKANYYFSKQEPEKAFAVLKMMVELYPTDLIGHHGLAQMYRYRNELEKSIAEYEKMLELDPYQYELLHTVGDLYTRIGNDDKALSCYKKYASANPQETASFTRLGNFYERRGDFEKARANYEKALLIDPSLVPVLIDLADIDGRLGHFSSALEQYEDALAKARSSEDRIRVYESLKNSYRTRGQVEKAIEFMGLEHNEAEPRLTPVQSQMQKIDNIDLYVKAGRPEQAFSIMDGVKSVVSPPFDKIVSLGYVLIHTEMGNPDEAEKELAGFEEYIKAFQLEMLRTDYYRQQGRIRELRGEYEQAILSYKKQMEFAATSRDAYRSIGRCYRHLADFVKAEDNLLKMLEAFPFEPETNYELALVYEATGKKTKALEHLQRSLEVWKEADEGFEPAKEARTTLERWKSSTPNI